MLAQLPGLAVAVNTTVSAWAVHAASFIATCAVHVYSFLATCASHVAAGLMALASLLHNLGLNTVVYYQVQAHKRQF